MTLSGGTLQKYCANVLGTYSESKDAFKMNFINSLYLSNSKCSKQK